MKFASPRWLLGVTFFLILPGLFWGLPSAFSPQVDAPVPLGPLLFVAEYGQSSLNTVYPAFHQLLLLPIYGVAMAVYWAAGGISHLSSVWPYGLRDVSALFSCLILLSNLVSTVMGLAILYIAMRLVNPHKNWAWVGVLLAAVNGVFIYYCRTATLDIPYNFWWAVTLFLLWRYLVEDKPLRSSLLPAAIAAACAVGSKDQAVGLVIGAGVLVLLCPTRQAGSFAARIRAAAVFTVLLLIGYGVVAVLPQPARWWHHARFVVSDHAPTPIPLSASGEVQIFWITLDWLARVFTIPVLALALAGAWYLFRNRRARELWILAVPLIFYYCIIIGKTRVFYPRFSLPFFIPVIVLVTHGAALLAERIFVSPRGRLAWSAACGALIVFQFAVSYVPVTYAQAYDLKRQLAADLPGVLPPGSSLLMSNMQSYNYPNRIVYDSYALMKLPQDVIQPPSRHAASVFRPLDENVAYFLLGSGNAGLPWNPVGDYPALSGDLVREWRYPAWVRQKVLVPCIYEFALYRRTGPLPLTTGASLGVGVKVSQAEPAVGRTLPLKAEVNRSRWQQLQ